MSEYNVEVKAKEFDNNYFMLNRFAKFVLLFAGFFYMQHYFLSNYKIENIPSQSFYLTVVFMVIIYLADSFYPNCVVNIIENKN